MNVCSTAIHNRIALKYPLLFTDVIRANLASMLKDTLKQMSMDIQKFQRGKRERLLIQQLCNIGSNTVCLFLFSIVSIMRNLIQIIRL